MRFSFISAGLLTAEAVTFWYIGQIGVLKVVFSIAAANCSSAGFISGLWNAPPTGNIKARLAPASVIFSHAASTDRKSTRLNSSHVAISYAVFCLKKKNI